MTIDEKIIDKLATELLKRLQHTIEIGLKLRSPESILKLLKLTADAKEAVRFLQESEKTELLNFETLEQNIKYELEIIQELKNDNNSIEGSQSGEFEGNGILPGAVEGSKRKKEIRSGSDTNAMAFSNWSD